MKATLLIRKDHEKLQDLFDKYRKTKTIAQNGRRKVFDEIRRELTVHSHLETELFYPELKNSSASDVDALIQAAENAHRQLESLLAEIEALSGNEKQFDAKVIELIDLITQHIQREEEEIFDQIRRSLSEQRLEELGLEMEDRRRILTQIAA
jgi:hemerythrin superfamily protein